MAKTNAKKVVAKATPVKKEEKKVVKKETVVASKEEKKGATKVETKKLTTAKAPKKIAAKPEPKKIANAKEPVKLTVKDEVKDTKKAASVVEKKTPVKKAVAKTSAPAAKVEEKAKTVKKAVKAKKIVDTKETKVDKKVEKVVEKKAPAKKAKVVKAVDEEKLAYYNSLPVEECIALMQAMQVHYDYDDYNMLLLDEGNLKTLEKNIIEGNHIKEQNLSFKEQGFDEDLISITLEKVALTMDVKASDYPVFKKAITKASKFKMSDDGEVNAQEYLDEFALSEKLLMIGQRKHIHAAKDLGELIGADVNAFFKNFFDLANAILPTWQYNDVAFYEDFAYAIMSQYADVFETEQLRVQIDVADLYIKHGDYQHGDEMYGYILRDNKIKDYIYFRYASVYKDIDYNKAKSIAYSSLQFIDDRYVYYANIMEIINQ